MTAMELIEQGVEQLVVAIRGGKLEWTVPELAPFLLEQKDAPTKNTPDPIGKFLAYYKKEDPEFYPALKDASRPDLNVAPTAPARYSLICRTIATVIGSTVENAKGKYIFSKPTKSSVVPTIIEKIVEKPIYIERGTSGDDLNVQLRFPPKPMKRPLLDKYQTPPWYKRMETALNGGRHVALAGPPGIGKSTGPEQYFVRKDHTFIIVNGDAGFRRRDIQSTTQMVNGNTWEAVAEFAAAAINGWGAIINEVNAADPDALLWINGILEEKVINLGGKAYPVHPDFILVVTYNPGLIGTKALPQAFKDRFFPVKLGFPNREFVKRIVVAKMGCSPDAPYLDRLLKYADDCWKLHEKGNLRYQISPRRLFDTVFLMQNGEKDLNIAIKQAIIDAVDSAADVQMMMKLVTSPLNEIAAVSQYG